MLYKHDLAGFDPIPSWNPAKVPVKILMVLLIFCCGMFPAPAQKKEPGKKGSLEILFGFNALGPAKQMFGLMQDYHFDATVNNFFGGTATHPHYRGIPLTGQLSYSYEIGAKSKAGLLLSYASLNEVLGASTENEGVFPSFLFESFSNVSIIPIYSYQISKTFGVQAGPALMFNKAKETSLPSNSNFKKVAAGLLAGVNVSIWDKSVTYGKIGGSYLFATPNKMGPFYTDDSSSPGSPSIPESNIGFGHLTIGFVLGFHL